MKKILIFSALALLGLGIFSGCSKSSSSSPSYTMAASIGGTAFNAGNCISLSSGGFTEIEGFGGSTTAPTYPYLAIFLSNYSKTTGSFTVDSTFMTNYAEIVTSATTYKIAKSGTITISSASSTSIVGTFSFTCTDGTVVSGGSFTSKGY